ncbi:MAG: hypothetical protein HRT98_00515 [Mycoplasmatales bacterium]|nr:hypothetical protein [Mycoplasmatales bacterium]
MPVKKKVSIILSIITAILALITLMIGVAFIVNAKNTINEQMDSYSVNQKTIMWIADLGKPFFGSSTEFAISAIALSLIALMVISIIWLIILLRKKKKDVAFNGSKTVIVASSLTTLAAVTSLGVASYATTDFNKNTDMSRVSKYFEENASKISENKEEAAKAGLLYVLANKNDLSAFSNASALQMSLSTTVFASIKEQVEDNNAKVITELEKFSKKNPELYEPVLGQFNGKLIKGDSISSAAQKWIEKFDLGKIALDPNGTTMHAANILLNNDAYIDLISGDYPEIQSIVKTTFNNNELFATIPFKNFPDKIQKIIKEAEYYNTVDHPGEYDAGVFEWSTKIGVESSKFEKRVLGTIAKLFKMPYATKEEKVKARITILEWLNTIINGIDYISKDETIKVQQNVKNIYGVNISTASTIYMPTTSIDGTFSINKMENKIVGKAGDNTYDVKLNMMKYILRELPKAKDGIIEKLLERQKNITPDSFIKNILTSKGLEEMTNQYAMENYYIDENNHYQEEENIINIVDKIENFIK